MRRPIEMVTASLNQLAGVRDYSYVFVKRERCDGQMAEFDAIYMKIRKQPFSVYVHTLGPVQPRGQEGIYVEGRNENKALVHLVGFRHKLVGVLRLNPEGPEMMAGNRYPITSAGFEKLLEKVLLMYRDEAKQPESQVQFFSGAKVDGRSCLCVEVSHPVRKPEFFFQMTRIFYDDELNVPIRWEAYDWPAQPGAQPQLGEEYTFRDVRLNLGLTDADFDTENSQYGFK